MKNNKWILTRTMNLGFCRETFKAGSVIVEMDDYLMINGRDYKDTRDLDILKRQMLKNPEDAWIIPYTEEDERRILENGKADVVVRRRPPTDHAMPVISSDDDLIEAIDVSNTQVSVVNERKRQAERTAAKDGKLPIVQEAEDIEDRIRRIAGKSDAASIAERVELKSGGLQKMTIVRDDTLGAQYGSKQTPALNAGQVIPAKHIGSNTTKPVEDEVPVHDGNNDNVDETRKFSLENIVEGALSKYLGNLGGLAEKFKMLEELYEKLKMIEAIYAKIKQFEQINTLLQKYNDLNGLLETLLGKLSGLSSSSLGNLLSGDGTAVQSSDKVEESPMVADGTAEAPAEEPAKQMSSKKGKSGRKQKR